MLKAPYKVTFYGTDEYFESDVNSEVNKSSIINVEYESQDIECFILRPFKRFESEIKIAGNSSQIESSIQYSKFEIVTTRMTNLTGDYADITVYDNLLDVFNYRYKYLEVNRYIRALHTVNKLIKGVVTKCDTVFTPNRVYVEIEFEKEFPNG